MTKAIIVAFHKYTPFGDEFYEPILDFFLANMKKYEDEYDQLYLVDSNWNIKFEKMTNAKITCAKVSPHLRYYDAYKQILPLIKEDLVLFMDNDMVVYKPGKIKLTFDLLQDYYDFENGRGQTYVKSDVVSIYDTIGTYKTDKLNGKNKFCPYWFATRRDLLMKYRDVEWGPNMPEHETLGKLTEAMLVDGIKPYEWEEDKSNCLFDSQDGEMGKNLGYYHIRAGSTPAYLLATKKYGDIKTYWDYINNQPQNEYLRQCAWYDLMMPDINPYFLNMLNDMKVTPEDFYEYMHRFKNYHGL